MTIHYSIGIAILAAAVTTTRAQLVLEDSYGSLTSGTSISAT